MSILAAGGVSTKMAPKRAGAVTPKRLELGQNGGRIWGRLWISFGEEQDRGVDVWGAKAGESRGAPGVIGVESLKTQYLRNRTS